MNYYDNLAEACAERQKLWGGANKIDLAFRGLELGGEVGELQEMIQEIMALLLTSNMMGVVSGKAQNNMKKLIRLREKIVGTSEKSEDLMVAIAEELADVVICAQLVAGDLDIDLNEWVPKKFNKTSEKHNIPIMMNK